MLRYNQVRIKFTPLLTSFFRDIPDFGVCCGWDYLACTTTYQPYGQSGAFLPSAWNVTEDIQNCQNEFGVTLDPYYPYLNWGSFGKQNSRVPLIVFRLNQTKF